MLDNYIKGFSKMASPLVAAMAALDPGPAATAISSFATGPVSYASPSTAANSIVLQTLLHGALNKNPAPLFDLTLPAKHKKGSPFWEGSIMRINVPGTETNPVFTNALKKPFKLSQKEFRKFTPVDPRILAHFGLLSDQLTKRRVQLILTGALNDPRIRANLKSRGSSSASGKTGKGKVVTGPVPVPDLPKTKYIPIDWRLAGGMPKDKGLAALYNKILNQQARYPRFASRFLGAYGQYVLRAQRKAFLTYGRLPNKPGYLKRFDYSSYKDPTKGIGALMVRNPRFDALNDKLDTNYMSYINSKAFKDFNAALKSGATILQARTAYYNSLAANWYGDYRDKPGDKQNDMLEYANKLRNPDKRIALKARKRDKLDAWWMRKTDTTPLVPPRIK